MKKSNWQVTVGCKIAVFTMLLLIMAGIVNGVPLELLDSAQFAYRYEQDEPSSGQDLDNDGNADFYPNNAGELPVLSGGIASFDTGDFYRTDFSNSIWRANFPQDAEYTIEARLRITETDPGDEGTLGIMGIFVRDMGDNSCAIAYVGMTRVQVNDGGTVTELDTSDNTDGFHVFRVARNAEGFWVWRDNVLLNPDENTPFSEPTIGGGKGHFLGDTSGTGNNGSWDLDWVRIDNTGAYGPESRAASQPNPKNGLADVPRDVALAWTPGDYAVTHDVYLGTAFEDVNAASVANPLDVLVSQGQTGTTFDAGALAFGQTYYWRVDEVNGAPDNTVFRGDVWRFEVEPYAYPIESITATASSAHDADMVPEKTIDGSGLDALDLHSNDAKDMWLSGAGIQPVWIQYAFDQAYKLHELWVWNSNQSIEAFVGLGAKDVTIEISTNGADWTQLENIPPFAQATGQAGYAHNTVVDLGGVVAQYVKLTIDSGYGMLPQSGLSEVRFFYIPTYAREAQPADSDTTDTVDVVLNWRTGREAAVHEIYLGTDPMDLALVHTGDESSAAIGPLDYDTTYYWQIVEVNDAEDPTSYASDVWRFNTPAYGIVDDFESYGNDCQRIFFAWLDGLGHNGGEDLEDCDVAPYNGNGTGSIVGHGTSPFAEQTIIYAGRQAMPLEYSSAVSETTIALDAQDWTTSGIQTLSLVFYGAPGNTGQLYLKINNTKVSYAGLSDALQRQQWVPWNIDLAATGANLTNVTNLTLGIEGASAAGMIYVDEIRLYPLAPETIEPVIPNDNDPTLVAFYEFEGNANDSVGSYHGTVAGDPVYTAGKVGQAISLDEIDDHVVHALAQEEVWSAYSVCLWVKTDLMGQDQFSGLFNNNSSSADFQIEVNGNDTYLYRGAATGAFGPVSSDWVHLTATCDGVQTRLYYNGLQAGTLDAADTRFGQLAVGINRGMSNRFGGTIDEVRVYNRALSAGEVGGLAGITDSIPKAF